MTLYLLLLVPLDACEIIVLILSVLKTDPRLLLIRFNDELVLAYFFVRGSNHLYSASQAVIERGKRWPC